MVHFLRQLEKRRALPSLSHSERIKYFKFCIYLKLKKEGQMMSAEPKSREVYINVLEEENISMNTTLENIRTICGIGAQWGSAFTDPQTKKHRFWSGRSVCTL